MKIAVFGGSFDPPHIGHKKVVKEAIKQLDIDHLIIVPTYLNPFKKEYFLSSKKRYKLLKKLFKKNKHVIVSNYETKQKKSVYSIETIQHIKKTYRPKKIYFIIGADNLAKLHLWYKYKRLKKEVEFVVAKRNGFLNQKYAKIKTLNVNIKISSTQLRDKLNLKYIPKEIRKNVKKNWHKKATYH